MRWLNLYTVTLSILAIVLDIRPQGRHHLHNATFRWSASYAA